MHQGPDIMPTWRGDLRYAILAFLKIRYATFAIWIRDISILGDKIANVEVELSIFTQGRHIYMILSTKFGDRYSTSDPPLTGPCHSLVTIVYLWYLIHLTPVWTTVVGDWGLGVWGYIIVDCEILSRKSRNYDIYLIILLGSIISYHGYISLVTMVTSVYSTK